MKWKVRNGKVELEETWINVKVIKSWLFIEADKTNSSLCNLKRRDEGGKGRRKRRGRERGGKGGRVKGVLGETDYNMCI